jgi:hypothetical protein
MIDYPGSYHSGSGNFVLLTAIPRRDTGGSADDAADYSRVLVPLNVSQPASPDIEWLNQHATEPR